jgi:hypothetical protein
MSNIIKFPKEIEQPAAPAPVEPAAASAAPNKAPVLACWPAWSSSYGWRPCWSGRCSSGCCRFTFFQFVRMLYHWNTPGVYAGWSFLAYFAVLTAITYFVSIYKPKGL